MFEDIPVKYLRDGGERTIPVSEECYLLYVDKNRDTAALTL